MKMPLFTSGRLAHHTRKPLPTRIAPSLVTGLKMSQTSGGIALVLDEVENNFE